MAGLDLKHIYDSFRQGQKEARQNRLADLDELGQSLHGQVIAGDKTKLAELARVSPERFAAAKQFTDSEKRQFVTDFTRAAYGAKTPQAWNALVARYEADGHQFDDWEKDPANREAVIAQGLDLGDQMGLDLRREQSAAEASRWQQQYTADQNYRDAQLDIAHKELGLKGAQAPDLVELYDEQTGQPYKARYNAQTGRFDRIGGVKAPNGTQLEVGPDGSVKFNQGMGKPLTEAQGKDTVYATRAEGALPLIDQYGDALTSFGENLASRAPLIGNYIKTPAYQQAQQAGDEFLQAILRKDTGAAITKEEKGEYGVVYLPQPGDSPQVLKQKQISRRRALEAIQAGMPPHALLAKEKALANTGAATGQGAQTGKTRRGISFEVGE